MDPLDHPGGAAAAAIEETIAPTEQPVYRALVTTLAERYTPGPEIAEAAYVQLTVRRLRASMEQVVATRARRAELREFLALSTLPDDQRARAQAEDRTLVDLPAETTRQDHAALAEAQKELRQQLASLDKREAGLKQIDPDRELREAEQWVHDHLGEFEARCPTCAAQLTVPALPHWAFEPHHIADGPDTRQEYLVWSPELWQLVVDRTLDLWVMAYVLRVSPEGLLLTAQLRGEDWPDWIDIPAQETALQIRLSTLSRAMLLTHQPTERGGSYGA